MNFLAAPYYLFDSSDTLDKIHRPTLVPLHVTVETALRHAQLPVLMSANPLSALIARQALAFEARALHIGEHQVPRRSH